VFLDHLERELVPNLDAVGYHRYVDDIFMLVKDERSAEEVLSSFNQAHPNIQFELEKPKGSTLQLLDLQVRVSNGSISSSFYVKEAKSDLFIQQ
jgi:hypothetical protein